MKTVSFVIALLLTGLSVSPAMAHAVPATRSTSSEQTVPEHVILFVLEGVDQQALKVGPMPNGTAVRSRRFFSTPAPSPLFRRRDDDCS